MTRQGLRDLLFEIADRLETTPEFPLYDEEDMTENRVMYKLIHDSVFSHVFFVVEREFRRRFQTVGNLKQQIPQSLSGQRADWKNRIIICKVLKDATRMKIM